MTGLTARQEEAIQVCNQWLALNEEDLKAAIGRHSNQGVWVVKLAMDGAFVELAFLLYQQWLDASGMELPSVSSRTYWVAMEAVAGQEVVASQLLTVEAGPAPTPPEQPAPAETTQTCSLWCRPQAPLLA